MRRTGTGISPQRGAISIMAAIGLSLALAAALLAVDLGNLFQSRRHLQTVADTAALSAVNNLNAAQAIAIATAEQNGFAIPGAHANTLSVQPGYYDLKRRTFSPAAAAADFNALQVTVTTEEPYFFMFGQRQITAMATATRNDIAALSVGTALIDIDTQKSILLNSLLGVMLKTSLNLSVAAYQGLVGTSLRLLDLVNVQGSVGTVEELLKLDLTVKDLLNLSARALEQSNLLGLDATVINTLDLLSLQTDAGLALKLSDLIKLDLAPGNQAAEARINLLQLVTLAAQVANGQSFLNIPMLNVSLPGLVRLDVALSMLEKPSIAIGPAGLDGEGKWRTSAHTAQWRLKLDLVVGELLGGIVNLPLYLEVGAGDAWLEDIVCRFPRDSSTVQVGATSSAVRAYVGNVNPDAMSNRTSAATVTPATILNVLGLVTVTAQANVNVVGSSGDLQFTGPFNGNNTQRISGLSTAGLFSQLASALVLDVNLLGLPLGVGGVLSLVVNLLQPVFVLLDAILAPVLALLGIQLGIADVTVFDLSCGVPQLVR